MMDNFLYTHIQRLKVGPGKTKKILEKSWNFLTKKVYEPCIYLQVYYRGKKIVNVLTTRDESFPRTSGFFLF
jgi:hypothetical protein